VRFGDGDLDGDWNAVASVLEGGSIVDAVVVGGAVAINRGPVSAGLVHGVQDIVASFSLFELLQGIFEQLASILSEFPANNNWGSVSGLWGGVLGNWGSHAGHLVLWRKGGAWVTERVQNKVDRNVEIALSKTNEVFEGDSYRLMECSEI
jgi:hypothetical protein